MKKNNSYSIFILYLILSIFSSRFSFFDSISDIIVLAHRMQESILYMYIKSHFSHFRMIKDTMIETIQTSRNEPIIFDGECGLILDIFIKGL